MRKPTIDELKYRFTRLGYKWDKFHFIGIRSKANAKNQYDDLFGVVNGDTLKWFDCTTNAGAYWLKNLLNPNGCAVLVPKQYVDTWQLGLHKGKYKALVQAKMVDVYRDNDRDDLAEEQGKIERGFFGINIHKASDSVVSKLIDKWSAGCQVIPNAVDFREIIFLAEESKQKFFTYTLLNEF
jgi:hypothetical protein